MSWAPDASVSPLGSADRGAEAGGGVEVPASEPPPVLEPEPLLEPEPEPVPVAGGEVPGAALGCVPPGAAIGGCCGRERVTTSRRPVATIRFPDSTTARTVMLEPGDMKDTLNLPVLPRRAESARRTHCNRTLPLTTRDSCDWIRTRHVRRTGLTVPRTVTPLLPAISPRALTLAVPVANAVFGTETTAMVAAKSATKRMPRAAVDVARVEAFTIGQPTPESGLDDEASGETAASLALSSAALERSVYREGVVGRTAASRSGNSSKSVRCTATVGSWPSARLSTRRPSTFAVAS